MRGTLVYIDSFSLTVIVYTVALYFETFRPLVPNLQFSPLEPTQNSTNNIKTTQYTLQQIGY